MNFIVPTLLGLESFCARELKRMGYDTQVEDGRVMFSGDEHALADANINLRTGERVLIKVAEFEALTFEELFENTKNAPWSDYIPCGGAFPVKGHSLKSQLASVPDCQKIIKKAVASKLGEKYGFEKVPEDGELYQIQFSIRKNVVTLMIDTSGAPLHKRGYRTLHNLAPLRETIASAMIMLSYWKYETPLIDPFCGSGTIPIEAVMFKKNIAPGVNRAFAAENFSYIQNSVWEQAREKAKSFERDIPLEVYGYDINPECVSISEENARRSGTDGYIKFAQRDVRKFFVEENCGSVICNPPYGERLGEKKECYNLYADMGKVFRNYDMWSYYILASDEDFEKHIGQKADKKRKVYNGMIKCNIYQYFDKMHKIK